MTPWNAEFFAVLKLCENRAGGGTSQPAGLAAA
jgi:hypothetical protein